MATPTMEESRFGPNPPIKVEFPFRETLLRRGWLPLLLLLLTIFTTASSGARLMRNFHHGLPPLASEDDFFPLPWMLGHPSAIVDGWSFSLTLLAILLAHEAGHFFYCRKHGIRASLPYVLPAPTLSGTAGAVIRIRSRIASRRALIEIGIAGPIAGYLVAVPAAIVGMLLSRPAATVAPPLISFHQPLTIMLLHHALAAFLPGLPRAFLPHPILLASWIGFFITSLNLIPAGQLDGGHILYAVSPRWHRRMTFAVPVLLLAMGLGLWAGWLLWGAILLLPVMRHPPVSYYPTLPGESKWLGWLALAMLVLTFLPAPFAGTGLLQFWK